MEHTFRIFIWNNVLQWIMHDKTRMCIQTVALWLHHWSFWIMFENCRTNLHFLACESASGYTTQICRIPEKLDSLPTAENCQRTANNPILTNLLQKCTLHITSVHFAILLTEDYNTWNVQFNIERLFICDGNQELGNLGEKPTTQPDWATLE